MAANGAKKQPPRGFAILLRDQILLGIWVFSYRIILLIFSALRRLEAKRPSSI